MILNWLLKKECCLLLLKTQYLRIFQSPLGNVFVIVRTQFGHIVEVVHELCNFIVDLLLQILECKSRMIRHHSDKHN